LHKLEVAPCQPLGRAFLEKQINRAEQNSDSIATELLAESDRKMGFSGSCLPYNDESLSTLEKA